jgi:hypothetical protein
MNSPTRRDIRKMESPGIIVNHDSGYTPKSSIYPLSMKHLIPASAVLIFLLAAAMLSAQDNVPMYRLTKGQKFFYQRVTEQNDPVFDDSFMQTQECEVRVEDVDASGNARIIVTILKDTILYRTLATQGGMRVPPTQLQPRIEFTMSPRGEIMGGTILQRSAQYLKLQQMAEKGERVKLVDDSLRIRYEAGLWFPRLPRFNAGENLLHADTLVNGVEIPTGDDTTSAKRKTVRRMDSTITTYQVVGIRNYGGLNCLRMVMTERSRLNVHKDAVLHRQDVAENYFRTNDGVLVHGERTTVAMVGIGVGRVTRVSQNIIGTW